MTRTNVIFLIITILASKTVGLQTQKGIIYGRTTPYSMEYLGLDKNKLLER